MRALTMIIRRVHGSVVHLTFAKPIRVDGEFGLKLAEFAATKPDVHLTREEDAFTAVECDQKALLSFLSEAGISRETIAGFRRALDDSKKAQRERMRGNR